jgi:hypothetical protein
MWVPATWSLSSSRFANVRVSLARCAVNWTMANPGEEGRRMKQWRYAPFNSGGELLFTRRLCLLS